MHPSKEIVGSLSDVLKGRRVALCVTGSVSAYLSPAIARELMRHGAEVTAFLTRDACRLVTPTLLQWATGNPAVTDMTGELEHVRYGREVDLVLVAPATANTLAKIASGIADNVVTALALTAMGYGKIVAVAPAMHEPMWMAEQTRRNVETLRRMGVVVLEPSVVEQKAKLAEPAYIAEQVLRLLHPKKLPEGVKVLVSAGATVEYLDSIRVVTNQSSGRMGLEIALESYRRGAEATLILGHASVEPPSYIKKISVNDSESLRETVTRIFKTTPPDIYFSAIAVADYKPVAKIENKVDTALQPRISIQLSAVDKVLPLAKSLSPSTVVVAFKAEYRVDDKQLLDKARRLLAYSDIVYASDVSRPEAWFGSETTSGIIIDRNDGVVHVVNRRKSEVAAMLLDKAASMLSGR
ncbi:MAG: bifunctional phosphopantothenoylcysteine decarboxylase/phosphopantothenate--cysteine ligase CoaBC [Candidatus Caldarchaeum sp.]